MAQFIIRVVLHDNATWQDYNNLAAQMAAVGAVDVILADDGGRYRLPPAEYVMNGPATAVQARDLAANAVARVGKRYGVLATQSAGIAWSGLDRA